MLIVLLLNFDLCQKKIYPHEESLALIESMINRAKGHVSENGQLYLLWGWLVFFCSIFQFVMLYFFHNPNGSLVWLITWVGAIYSGFKGFREKRTQRVRTYADEIIGYVWITFVITLFLMMFAVTFRGSAQAWERISPVILVMYGIPSFLSGIILRFRPLIIGGICCWGLSIISMFLVPEFQILMLAIAMLLAWIIPGYKLREKYKKEMVSPDFSAE